MLTYARHAAYMQYMNNANYTTVRISREALKMLRKYALHESVKRGETVAICTVIAELAEQLPTTTKKKGVKNENK